MIPDNPWFIRGGNANNGVEAGAFNSNNDNGNANDNNSWRPVFVAETTIIKNYVLIFHSVIMFKDIMVMHIVETLFLFSR